MEYTLRLGDYRTCVVQLSARLLGALRNRAAFSMGRHWLLVAASTYGVFLPAWAANAQSQLEQTLDREGWPAQSALRGQLNTTAQRPLNGKIGRAV